MRMVRHAAALALVGWYLMTPPLSYPTPGGPASLDYKAPLGTWTISRAFDSAKECEDYKLMAEGRTKKDQNPIGETNAKERFANALVFSQCIATDDPRLKEK